MSTQTTTPTEAVIGNVLSLLGRNRMSQTTLAGKLNLSQPALSRRLSGLVSFNVEELEIIADAFDMPVYQLFDGTPWTTQGTVEDDGYARAA